MGAAPLCSECFCQNARTGKKKAPAPVGPTDSAWFIAVCCQTARHSSPRFSPSSRCRDTTSCVGVGRVSSYPRVVKKHRCHNWGSGLAFYFMTLRCFVPQESPVNTSIFDICRNRARHNNLCPPHAHRIRTSHPQDARRTAATPALRCAAIAPFWFPAGFFQAS